MKTKRDYVSLCIDNAEQIHKAMKKRGLYTGKVVKIGDVEVQIPSEYPVKVLTAFLQFTDSKDGTPEQLENVDIMGEMLLKVNGVDNDDLILTLTVDDITRLAGEEVSGGGGSKKPEEGQASKPSKT